MFTIYPDLTIYPERDFWISTHLLEEIIYITLVTYLWIFQSYFYYLIKQGYYLKSKLEKPYNIYHID